MAFFILSIFFLWGPPSQQADSTVEQRSRAQIKGYAQAVRRGRQVDLNLWAIAETGRGQASIKSFTKAYLIKHHLSQPALQVFRDTTLAYPTQLHQLAFAAKSPVLLVAYLLAEANPQKRRSAARRYEKEIGYPSSRRVNYAAVVKAILQERKITPDLLPAEAFHPLHFFLFANATLMRAGTFSKSYLKTVSERWHITGPPSLKKSMGVASLFRIYFAFDQYEKIQKLYPAISQNTFFPISPLKLTFLRMMDYSMYRLGYYNRSLNIIQSQSLALATYLKQGKTVLKLQIARSVYLYQIGKIEESKQLYLQIQQQAEAQHINVSEARIFNNLAIDYWKSGEFERYLALQFKALKAAQKEHSYSTQLNILKNLFTHYRVNKDFNSAKRYLVQAQQLALKQGDKKDLAQLSFYEGLLYQDLNGNYGHAFSAFNDALAFISPENYYDFYQRILIKKALLLEKQKRYHQAKAVDEKILRSAKQRNDRRNLFYASFGKANALLMLGQRQKAQTILDSLKTKNLDPLDFPQLVRAKTIQAQFYKITGQPENGIKLLQPVITQILKRSRGSGDIETGFWQVEPEYLNAFELYANLLIGNHQPAKAVEALDRLKTINDAALYQNPLVRSRVLNEKELSQYKRLTTNLDDLRRQLLAAKKKQQKKLQQHINELSAKKSVLDQKISSSTTHRPVSIRHIQSRMDAHRRLLHITELNDTYYVATISRTAVHIKKIPITPALRARFEQSITQITGGKPDLNQLYGFTKLLGINALPSQVHALTIIPDSYLYQLPMDVLPVNPPAMAHSYGDATYLIEQFKTNYMTSLNDFNKNPRPAHYKYGFAGYGISQFAPDRTTLIPLPEAKTEIKSIYKQLTALPNKKIFLNDDATEQAFRQTASQARILHLATHSQVDNRNPLFSSIYLKRSAGATNNDFPGRIFAYQLFELNLSNELVMLNSCESGSGSYLQGTGVVGISRALRYAGAQSLVLNLWSVNDMMASEFAARFYSEINRGATKAEALQKAKLYFLSHKNANPHYWGLYMLLGNKSAIVKPDNKTNQIVGVSFMLFFFSMVAACSFVEVRRRKR